MPTTSGSPAATVTAAAAPTGASSVLQVGVLASASTGEVRPSTMSNTSSGQDPVALMDTTQQGLLGAQRRRKTLQQQNMVVQTVNVEQSDFTQRWVVLPVQKKPSFDGFYALRQKSSGRYLAMAEQIPPGQSSLTNRGVVKDQHPEYPYLGLRLVEQLADATPEKEKTHAFVKTIAEGMEVERETAMAGTRSGSTTTDLIQGNQVTRTNELTRSVESSATTGSAISISKPANTPGTEFLAIRDSTLASSGTSSERQAPGSSSSIFSASSAPIPIVPQEQSTPTATALGAWRIKTIGHGALYSFMHRDQFLDSKLAPDHPQNRTTFLAPMRNNDRAQKWLIRWTGKGNEVRIIKHANGEALDSILNPQNADGGEPHAVTRPLDTTSPSQIWDLVFVKSDCQSRVTSCAAFDCGFVDDGCGDFVYCGNADKLKDAMLKQREQKMMKRPFASDEEMGEQGEEEVEEEQGEEDMVVGSASAARTVDRTKSGSGSSTSTLLQQPTGTGSPSSFSGTPSSSMPLFSASRGSSPLSPPLTSADKEFRPRRRLTTPLPEIDLEDYYDSFGSSGSTSSLGSTSGSLSVASSSVRGGSTSYPTTTSSVRSGSTSYPTTTRPGSSSFPSSSLSKAGRSSIGASPGTTTTIIASISLAKLPLVTRNSPAQLVQALTHTVEKYTNQCDDPRFSHGVNPLSNEPGACISNACVCRPKKQCSKGVECGFEDDGCGNRIACGARSLPPVESPEYSDTMQNFLALTDPTKTASPLKSRCAARNTETNEPYKCALYDLPYWEQRPPGELFSSATVVGSGVRVLGSATTGSTTRLTQLVHLQRADLFQCICSAKASCDEGLTCGVQADGCGGFVTCGANKAAGGACAFGDCVENQCVCTKKTTCEYSTCGMESDGCGGELKCGICSEEWQECKQVTGWFVPATASGSGSGGSGSAMGSGSTGISSRSLSSIPHSTKNLIGTGTGSTSTTGSTQAYSTDPNARWVTRSTCQCKNERQTKCDMPAQCGQTVNDGCGGELECPACAAKEAEPPEIVPVVAPPTPPIVDPTMEDHARNAAKDKVRELCSHYTDHGHDAPVPGLSEGLGGSLAAELGSGAASSVAGSTSSASSFFFLQIEEQEVARAHYAKSTTRSKYQRKQETTDQTTPPQRQKRETTTSTSTSSSSKTQHHHDLLRQLELHDSPSARAPNRQTQTPTSAGTGAGPPHEDLAAKGPITLGSHPKYTGSVPSCIISLPFGGTPAQVVEASAQAALSVLQTTYDSAVVQAKEAVKTAPDAAVRGVREEVLSLFAKAEADVRAVVRRSVGFMIRQAKEKQRVGSSTGVSMGSAAGSKMPGSSSTLNAGSFSGSSSIASSPPVTPNFLDSINIEKAERDVDALVHFHFLKNYLEPLNLVDREAYLAGKTPDSSSGSAAVGVGSSLFFGSGSGRSGSADSAGSGRRRGSGSTNTGTSGSVSDTTSGGSSVEATTMSLPIGSETGASFEDENNDLVATTSLQLLVPREPSDSVQADRNEGISKIAAPLPAQRTAGGRSTTDAGEVQDADTEALNKELFPAGSNSIFDENTAAASGSAAQEKEGFFGSTPFDYSPRESIVPFVPRGSAMSAGQVGAHTHVLERFQAATGSSTARKVLLGNFGFEVVPSRPSSGSAFGTSGPRATSTGRDNSFSEDNDKEDSKPSKMKRVSVPGSSSSTPVASSQEMTRPQTTSAGSTTTISNITGSTSASSSTLEADQSLKAKERGIYRLKSRVASEIGRETAHESMEHARKFALDIRNKVISHVDTSLANPVRDTLMQEFREEVKGSAYRARTAKAAVLGATKRIFSQLHLPPMNGLPTSSEASSSAATRLQGSTVEGKPVNEWLRTEESEGNNFGDWSKAMEPDPVTLK
ncbi:unnamed protein product [Amoebophrya sp. A25]|nr:unnamed protein product [Amoebophrya sp. A25]|eukprot:GSA25T00025225001.1